MITSCNSNWNQNKFKQIGSLELTVNIRTYVPLISTNHKRIRLNIYHAWQLLLGDIPVVKIPYWGRGYHGNRLTRSVINYENLYPKYTWVAEKVSIRSIGESIKWNQFFKSPLGPLFAKSPYSVIRICIYTPTYIWLNI